jgi:outer membrane immunogenic protein
VKKFLLSTVSVIAVTHAATAADLAIKAPPPPVVVPIWSGFYFGVDGGVARHEASFNDLAGAFSRATFSSSRTGGVAGVNVGYNWQAGSFVYGVEADWNWVGAKSNTTWGCPFAFCFRLQNSLDVPWVATFRGRAGLALDSTLVYFTGGLAAGQVKNSAMVFGSGFAVPPNPLLGTFSQNTTRVGWTAGIGVEHMFGPHWTARAELRYVDLGRSTVSCAPTPAAGALFCGSGYRGEFTNSLVMGLVGLDYKF